MVERGVFFPVPPAAPKGKRSDACQVILALGTQGLRIQLPLVKPRKPRNSPTQASSVVNFKLFYTQLSSSAHHLQSFPRPLGSHGSHSVDSYLGRLCRCPRPSLCCCLYFHLPLSSSPREILHSHHHLHTYIDLPTCNCAASPSRCRPCFLYNLVKARSTKGLGEPRPS